MDNYFYFGSKAIIIIRLGIYILFFFSGILWEKHGNINHLIIPLVLLIILLVFNLFVYYINSLAKKQVIFLKGRLEAVLAVLKVRTNQWYEIATILDTISETDNSGTQKILEKNILATRQSIKTVVKVIGTEFYKELLGSIAYSKDINIRVSYLQKDENSNEMYIRHPENVYFSDNVLFANENIKQTRFIKSDGSTAGEAWKTDKPIFIKNVADKLMQNSKKRFKVIDDESNIKSICCIPISHEEFFFGALCISSNKPDVIKDSKTYKQQMLWAFEPIIKQLELIELVKLVRDKHRVKAKFFRRD